MSIYTYDFNNRIDASDWDIYLFCFDDIGRRSYIKDRHGSDFRESYELRLTWEEWIYWVKRKQKWR